MEKIFSVKILLDRWPSRRVIAAETGASLDAVNKWPATNAVPARYHAALVESAARHGVPLTIEDLARLHDHRVRVPAPNEDAA